MNQENFSMLLVVDPLPHEVFTAINHVRGWWSEELQGDSEKAGDEFVYRHKDLHYSRHRLVEVVPDQKVVWLVTDSYLSFPEGDKSEWTGTKIVFEITREGSQTRLLFTHQGLVPELACFEACSQGWQYYLQNSLLPLITTGMGKPDRKGILSPVDSLVS